MPCLLVALYLRRSTNERLQADSLHTQEQILRAYAKGHSMMVVAVYRDSASGTSTKHRRAFLQMVETITHGAPFTAVLVRDVSRFGRFYDMDEAAFFEVLFLGHHVKTIYCEEVFTSDTTPMASLIKSVRRVMAAEYSRDRARLVRYGQARATRMGFHVTGPAPYGLQRVMVGDNGEPVCELRPGEWKALSSHRTVLGPGRSDQLATVQTIFAEFTSMGRTVAEIVRRLNAEGVASPQGSRWNAPTVAAILRNPRYTGVSRYRMRGSPPVNETASELVLGRFPGSPTIAQEVWDQAQERVAASVRRTSNDELAGDLRKAYELNGCAEERMLTKLPRRLCWETINARFFGGIEGALSQAYVAEIASARASVEGVLKSSFDVEADSEGWMIQSSLSVSFRCAWARAGSCTGHCHRPQREAGRDLPCEARTDPITSLPLLRDRAACG